MPTTAVSPRSCHTRPGSKDMTWRRYYALSVGPDPLQSIIDRPSLGRIIQKPHNRGRLRRLEEKLEREHLIQTHIPPPIMAAQLPGKGFRGSPDTDTNHDPRLLPHAGTSDAPYRRRSPPAGPERAQIAGIGPVPAARLHGCRERVCVWMCMGKSPFVH